MGLPTSLTFAVLSSTGSLQTEQIGSVVLKARFERRGMRRPFRINHQSAQETDAQNGSGGGMCYRYLKSSTERDACMYRYPSLLDMACYGFRVYGFVFVFLQNRRDGSFL